MNVEQQMKADEAYLMFMRNIVGLGVLMTAGAKPELAIPAAKAAQICLLRVVDRLARNFEAKKRGLI